MEQGIRAIWEFLCWQHKFSYSWRTYPFRFFVTATRVTMSSFMFLKRTRGFPVTDPIFSVFILILLPSCLNLRYIMWSSTSASTSGLGLGWAKCLEACGCFCYLISVADVELSLLHLLHLFASKPFRGSIILMVSQGTWNLADSEDNHNRVALTDLL